MKTIVLLIAQLDQTIMEKLVLHVLPLKNGTALNVLIGVILEESGMLLHKLVYAHQVNSGMVMLVLFAQVAKLGMPTLKAVNAQSHQPGMESHVLFVLEVESTTTLPLNVNAQLANHTMDMFALLTAQQVNSTTKH